MAKKVTAIICVVSWAVFALSFLFSDPRGGLDDTGIVLFSIGMMVGFFSLIVLGILALIDYARRPR